MFLPHLHREPVPVSPVAIVISRNRHPKIDRGSSLQVLQGSSWLSFSYHSNAADAVRAFQDRPFHVIQEPDRWRVLCHELDLNEFEPVAVRQPEPVY